MKTIKQFFLFLFLAGVSAMLLSCDKDYDPVFGESTDARVQAQLDEYTAQLTSAPYGWKASLKTGSGIRYFYYLEFAADGTVTMLSDFNETTAGTAKSSLWTLKALQSATLSFTTYSYIHLPADPDGGVNGGNNGEGRISDSEFAFAGTSGDSLVLEGIQRGSRIAFLKATEDEQSLVRKGRLKDILHYVTANKALKLALSKDQVITFAFNVVAKTLTAQYISADGKQVENNKIPYVISMDGIVLGKPLTAYDITLQSFQWDADKSSYYTTTDGSRKEITAIKEVQLFKPSVPFANFIGHDYLAIIIPASSVADPLQGQSEDFAMLYSNAATSMLTGPYTLTLSDSYFIFDADAGKMYIVVLVIQNEQVFQCQFEYDYMVSGDGSFSFTYVGADDNGGAIQSDMAPILSYLDNDTFAGEYVGGGLEPLGGFFSKDRPAFSFSGYLSN